MLTAETRYNKLLYYISRVARVWEKGTSLLAVL